MVGEEEDHLHCHSIFVCPPLHLSVQELLISKANGVKTSIDKGFSIGYQSIENAGVPVRDVGLGGSNHMKMNMMKSFALC